MDEARIKQEILDNWFQGKSKFEIGRMAVPKQFRSKIARRLFEELRWRASTLSAEDSAKLIEKFKRGLDKPCWVWVRWLDSPVTACLFVSAATRRKVPQVEVFDMDTARTQLINFEQIIGLTEHVELPTQPDPL